MPIKDSLTRREELKKHANGEKKYFEKEKKGK